MKSEKNISCWHEAVPPEDDAADDSLKLVVNVIAVRDLLAYGLQISSLFYVKAEKVRALDVLHQDHSNRIAVVVATASAQILLSVPADKVLKMKVCVLELIM